MPEHRALSLVRWGEELRRHRNARRVGRARAFGAAGAALVAIATAITIVWSPRPLLVWNGSASSQTGLYGVSSADRIKVGDHVLAWAPEEPRLLAAQRGYLPFNIPLVKQVAAIAGDQVCARGRSLLVNGRVVALRRRSDRSGRALPWWHGCVRLSRDELLLLVSGRADSFDGRYFGTTRPEYVVGRARLLWAS